MIEIEFCDGFCRDFEFDHICREIVNAVRNAGEGETLFLNSPYPHEIPGRKNPPIGKLTRSIDCPTQDVVTMTQHLLNHAAGDLFSACETVVDAIECEYECDLREMLEEPGSEVVNVELDRCDLLHLLDAIQKAKTGSLD